MKTRSVSISMLACAIALGGCAAAPPGSRDPLEPVNRQVNRVNAGVDKAALRPAAKAYEHGVPGVVRTGVSNFFGNLHDPWSAVNSLLQGKGGDAAQDVMRFAFNTVFGFGGVLDIATELGIERHKQDFGTTLARWGVPPGPYLVLPVIGPSTLRDAVALPADWMGDPLRAVAPVSERNALIAGRAVDLRATLLPLDAALDEALDPYTFMRDAYLQHRQALIHGAADDGREPPLSEPETADGPTAPATRAPGPSTATHPSPAEAD